MIGNEQTAKDDRLLSQYHVTHIINTCPSVIENIFDPVEYRKKVTREKNDKTKSTNPSLLGKIEYFSIKDWAEHRVDNLEDMAFLTKVYDFIESATSKFKCCLIVSKHNKCSTIVIVIIYMMLKFKWTVHKTLEYICSRKSDIEITKIVIKQL